MSKIHVLTISNANWRVVAHVGTPNGTNSANVSWQQCLVASGRNVSTLPEGTGPGEISTAELAAVTDGSVAEHSVTIRPSSNPSPAEVEELTDIKIAEEQGRLAAELAYFGHEQG